MSRQAAGSCIAAFDLGKGALLSSSPLKWNLQLSVDLQHRWIIQTRWLQGIGFEEFGSKEILATSRSGLHAQNSLDK